QPPMSAAAMVEKLGLFGRIAVASKVLNEQQLTHAVQEMQRRKDGKNIGQVLIELGYLTPAQLEKLIAMQRQVVQKARSREDDPSRPAAETLPLTDLLKQAVAARASDLHIHSGAVMKTRAIGQFGNTGTRVLTPEDTERLVKEALNPEQQRQLDEAGQVDFC